MSSAPDLFAAAPPASAAQAEALALQHWRVAASARPLGGERDRNFHLRAADGAEYLLKLSHPAEDPAVTGLQTALLRHVAARDPALPVSRVLPTADGATEVHPPDGSGTVRLLSFLRGTPLHQAARSPQQRRALGAVLARLGLALDGFGHPAAGHDLLWDLQRAARTRPLLAHVADANRRALAERVLDGHARHVAPVQAGLRRQVIHNDLNPSNVLVDPADHDTIAALLDFGDAVEAPVVQEVAVACAYQPADPAAPLQAAAELVAGYHAVRPLLPAELDVLFDMIAARLAMALAIGHWNAARHPANAGYLLRNAGASWAALERLAPLAREEAAACLRRACGLKEGA